MWCEKMVCMRALLLCYSRNDFGGSRRPHQDSQRGGSFGDVPPFPNDPLRSGLYLHLYKLQ